MNKLICSLIAAVGFGALPAATAEEPASQGQVSATTAHPAAHRTLTRRHHRHHRHHKHHHHHHPKK
jgi:Ni/Co efflux regulator RcnB